MPKYPITPAIRALRQAAIEFIPHQFTYVEKGGTTSSAQALHIEEHAVIKTLMLQDQHKKPLVMLMHGDKEVSIRQLARQINAKHVELCDPKVAQKHSGYLVGGTSPFGLKHTMPIYAEASIAELETIYLNGGKRGFLVELNTQHAMQALDVTWVTVAI